MSRLQRVRYDHQSSIEYPKGDVTYSRQLDESHCGLESRGVGWAMLVFGHKTKGTISIHKKRCLGIYQCPQCEYIERPRLPSSRSQNAAPLEPRGQCKFDSSDLVHVLCRATMIITCDTATRTVDFQHFGFHNHSKPHPIRPTAEAKRRFRDIVTVAPEISPKKLLIGTITRAPLAEVHQSFQNLSRTAYHRQRILKGNHSTYPSLEFVASFEKNMNVKLFCSTCMEREGGHISMQTEHMAGWALEIRSPMQTDSVHGFIEDPNFDEINVTVTSLFVQL
jgi:hypothetical protein